MSEKKTGLDLIGETMQTPFELSGLVKVMSVELGAYFGKDAAFVKYLEDHPHGYKKDSVGWYPADELKPIEEN